MQQGTQESNPMADPTSGKLDSQETTHPALHPSITSIPVTPGVHLSGQSAYIDERQPSAETQENNLPFDPEKATPGPHWNANSYFAPHDEHRPTSPTDV